MDYSYLGSGKVFARVVGAADGLRFLGNVTDLTLAIAEDKKELKDRTQPGGGTYNEVTRIDSVEATIKMSDLSPENVALALYGAAAAITAGAVANEAATAYTDTFIKTAYPINTSLTVTVTGAGSPSPAYSAGTDFVVRGGGIEIPSGSTIPGGTPIQIDYTKKAGYDVQALVVAAQEYELVFDGLNEARSGKSVIVQGHRVKFGPAAALALLSEDYAELEVKGKLLKDTTKNGTSVSQYFGVQIVT